MGKITVFGLFNHKISSKMSSSCYNGLFFYPLPSNQNKTYINESNHFPTTSRGTFSIWGVALPSPGPRRTFSEFGDILALGVGQISNPPLTEGDTEVAGVSPLLKDTKKLWNPNVLCSPFFWIQNYSLLIGLSRYNPLFLDIQTNPLT